jgi:hypothetical protein
MQQTTKLQIYMSPSNTGQQQIELVKASQCLSELGNIIYITGDRKVFGQNVCSLLTRLEVFPMNQKLSVRTRILCSF